MKVNKEGYTRKNACSILRPIFSSVHIGMRRSMITKTGKHGKSKKKGSEMEYDVKIPEKTKNAKISTYTTQAHEQTVQ